MPDDISGKTPARKPSGGAGRRRRGPTVATPETLERAAYRYLARYAAPAGHLRRILLARVARSARFHGTDPAAGADAAEAIVAKLSAKGYLDDAAYARATGSPWTWRAAWSTREMWKTSQPKRAARPDEAFFSTRAGVSSRGPSRA